MLLLGRCDGLCNARPEAACERCDDVTCIGDLSRADRDMVTSDSARIGSVLRSHDRFRQVPRLTSGRSCTLYLGRRAVLNRRLSAARDRVGRLTRCRGSISDTSESQAQPSNLSPVWRTWV